MVEVDARASTTPADAIVTTDERARVELSRAHAPGAVARHHQGERYVHDA